MSTFNDKYIENEIYNILASMLMRSKFYKAKTNKLVFTPLKLWNKILSKLEEKDKSIFDGTKRILVLRDAFLAELIRERLPKGKRDKLFFAFDNDTDAIYRVVKQCIINKENIITGDILTNEELKNMPKFDVVIGNPPYQGNSQLHQRFFNMAVEMVKDGGIVAFLQPATPYLSKKRNSIKFKHHEQMKEYIKQYEITAWLFNPNMYFSDADIGNILSVTILKKVESDEKISSIVYDFNGEVKTFYDIALEDITIHGDEPEIVNSIRQKIKNYIEINGSFDDIVGNKDKPFACRLGKMRGDISGRNSKSTCNEPFFKNSFFTLVSKSKELHVFDDNNYENDEDGFVIYQDTQSEVDNVYNYCTTKFTQFALSLSKITVSNYRGELKTVPTVDFTVSWTDEKLFELFNLSQDEINFINSFIGDFYDK